MASLVCNKGGTLMKLYHNVESSTFPDTIRLYTHNCRLYDTGITSRYRTFFVQGDQPLYLKIGGKGSLLGEKQMLSFLRSTKVCAAVVAFEQDSDFDYLLTAALPGDNGTVPIHLHSPKRLAGLVGESLHRLHSLPTGGCPCIGPGQSIVEQTKGQLSRLDSRMARRLDLLGQLITDDSVVHGDFHLNDLMLNNWRLSGFTGLSHSGIGDRHYDISRALEELSRYLGNDQYKDILLDAYGREFIDPARLEYFNLLAQQGI